LSSVLIVEDNGWGTHDKSLPLTSRSIPPGVRVRAGFDSGQGELWSPERHRRARCRKPAGLFLSANHASSCWYLCWYRQQYKKKFAFNSIGYGTRRLSARGTILPSALIRQRSFSSIATGTSRIFGFAAVRPNLVVSGDFHGIFHGRSLGSWYRDFWVESNRCRSRTTPIFGT
jgi:hypothetical protein